MLIKCGSSDFVMYYTGTICLMGGELVYVTGELDYSSEYSNEDEDDERNVPYGHYHVLVTTLANAEEHWATGDDLTPWYPMPFYSEWGSLIGVETGRDYKRSFHSPGQGFFPELVRWHEGGALRSSPARLNDEFLAVGSEVRCIGFGVSVGVVDTRNKRVYLIEDFLVT